MPSCLVGQPVHLLGHFPPTEGGPYFENLSPLPEILATALQAHTVSDICSVSNRGLRPKAYQFEN